MRRSERLLRAVAVACLSTAVALAMHAAGGGTLPSVAGVLVPWTLALAVSAQLAGSPLSRWRLAAAVIASQAVFHLAFSWGVGDSVMTARGTGPHGGHGTVPLPLDIGEGAAPAHLHLTPTMIAAHTFAALATYAVLRRADVLLDFARRWARGLAARLLAPTPLRPSPVARALPPHPLVHGRTRIVASAHGLRGPPLSLS